MSLVDLSGLQLRLYVNWRKYMTFRSYDQPDGKVTVPWTYTAIAGLPPPSNYFEEQVTRVRNGFYSGVQTPGYHKKVADGVLLPLNAYERFDSFEDRPQGIYGGKYNNPNPLKVYRFVGTPCRVVVGSCREIDTARQVMTEMSRSVDTEVLLQRAVANITPDFDALTTVAEAHKTVRMLLNARRRAIALIKSASKSPKTFFKEGSSAWLEGRYGWRILQMDIENVTHYLRNPVRGLIVTGSSRDSVTKEVTVPYRTTGYHASYDWNGEFQRELQVRALAAAKFTVKTVNYVADLPITAWELAQLSFVADWFVTIGDVLKAWRVIRSASAVECSIGMKFSEFGRATVSNLTVGTGTYATEPEASGSSTSQVTLRTRTPRSVPTLIPQISVRLTSPRIIDAAALLAQRIM
jgi:hypothetical protein